MFYVNYIEGVMAWVRWTLLPMLMRNATFAELEDEEDYGDEED